MLLKEQGQVVTITPLPAFAGYLPFAPPAHPVHCLQRRKGKEREVRGFNVPAFSLWGGLGLAVSPTECQCPPKADITAELSPSRFGYVLSLTSSGLEVVTAQLLLNSYYPFFWGFPTLLPYLHK